MRRRRIVAETNADLLDPVRGMVVGLDRAGVLAIEASTEIVGGSHASVRSAS